MIVCFCTLKGSVGQSDQGTKPFTFKFKTYCLGEILVHVVQHTTSANDILTGRDILFDIIMPQKYHVSSLQANHSYLKKSVTQNETVLGNPVHYKMAESYAHLLLWVL